ncbi:hypothetical protein DCAR_0832532 [Daucus carota subsp. sativus]|uniref:Uncharacterized protein n=1 Tax=Daucus carota subsp. sativus TaxID=79200 RepID=A0A175YP93_DAUCS|nr:hypothetical protein DCAR_0832532 [Daucus carota subsp. sativus]
MEVETFVIKVVMFVVVQALVYLILSNSSNVFSDNKLIKSLSFKPARSLSISRMLASISDFPQSGEGSPLLTSSSSVEFSNLSCN